MSVYPTEVNFYGSVNMTEADGATVGGAVDLTRLITFADMAANGLVDYVSSSASDTATKCQISGLDGSGIQQTPAAVTLTGLTKVAGTQTFNRLLYGALTGASATGPLANPGGTAAVGDVAIMAHTLTITAHTAQAGSANHTGVTPPVFKVQSGDGASITLGMIIRTTGGTGSGQLRQVCSLSGVGAGQYGTDIVAVNRDWGTVPDATTTYEVAPGMLFPILPNPITSVVRPFSGVASDVSGGSTRTYYEKLFALNSDTSTAMTGTAILKQVDPSGLYAGSGALDINPCTALNDTNTTTNRQTVPASGIGSWSSGAAPQSITPAQQSAAANSAAQAQGFWVRLTLPPGLAPANGSFTLRVTGNTV
jgi:hypothetical protein